MLKLGISKSRLFVQDLVSADSEPYEKFYDGIRLIFSGENCGHNTKIENRALLGWGLSN